MSEFKPVAKKTIGYVPIQKVPFLLCLDDLAVLLKKECSTSRVDFKGIYIYICIKYIYIFIYLLSESYVLLLKTPAVMLFCFT